MYLAKSPPSGSFSASYCLVITAYWSNFILRVYLSGITVLLSLTVFMLLVAEIMPATSDSVPLIGKLTTAFILFYPLSNEGQWLWPTAAEFEKCCRLMGSSDGLIPYTTFMLSALNKTETIRVFWESIRESVSHGRSCCRFYTTDQTSGI